MNPYKIKTRWRCAVIGDQSSGQSIFKRPDKSVGHKFNDMQEMNPTNYNVQYTYTEIVRICSDCNTTKTPLWRGGTQGPKSLCNAYGIRQRKARKAMELATAAANPTQTNHSPTNNSKTQHINKQKKSRKSYATQHKQCGTCPNNNNRKHPSFEDFGLRLISKNNNSTSFQDHLFPKDEEEVAAILLMALSCGFMDN